MVDDGQEATPREADSGRCDDSARKTVAVRNVVQAALISHGSKPR